MEFVFVEVDLFTRKFGALGLEDEDLRKLQTELLRNPAAGAVDPGTCGLRKIRMPDPARRQGKRFGARVHYLLVPHRSTIYLVNVYPKAGQDALTAEQKKALCRLILRLTV